MSFLLTVGVDLYVQPAWYYTSATVITWTIEAMFGITLSYRMAALHWSSSIICLLPWSNHMICGMLCYHFMAYTYCNLLHFLCTNNACVEYHPFKLLGIFPQWLVVYIKLQYYNALLCKDHSRRCVCSGSSFIIDIGLLLTTQYFIGIHLVFNMIIASFPYVVRLMGNTSHSIFIRKFLVDHLDCLLVPMINCFIVIASSIMLWSSTVQ